MYLVMYFKFKNSSSIKIVSEISNEAADKTVDDTIDLLIGDITQSMTQTKDKTVVYKVTTDHNSETTVVCLNEVVYFKIYKKQEEIIQDI